MALPVLDGNQTATTLSSVVTGGEHIVAHSVVSLGATAIANITSAVSGSVVSISNFPSTQTIAGTVTVGNSITIGNFPAVQDVAINGNPAVYLVDDEQNPLGFGQYPVLASIDGTANVAIKDQANAFITSTITGSKRGIDANLISPVTIGSIPAISGSVTATISGTPSVTFSAITGSTSILNFPSTQTISGTVTANLNGYSQTAVSYSGSSVTAIPVALQTNGIYGGTLLAYNGANTVLRVGLDAVGGTALASGNSVPVSGTVTASAQNGSLTTRFGTPTTANTAFATSAVTNANRKYLLIQNVTTGSNVITVGIGFTPTTTQGIQLTAGAGITFESSYIPTGAVQILSSVTASNFTILEA